MESVAGATGHRVYPNTALEMRDDVSVGYPLNVAMKQANLFPHMVVQMTAVGQHDGALATRLFKVAECYEEEVNKSVTAIRGLLGTSLSEYNVGKAARWEEGGVW